VDIQNHEGQQQDLQTVAAFWLEQPLNNKADTLSLAYERDEA